jgi:uncharacterized membrane protein YhhN
VILLFGLLTLGGLLYAETRGWEVGRWLFKLLCSLGYLVLALSFGWGSSYAEWVFLGLALCFLGDVLLLSRRSRVFLAGLIAFLLGHMAFAVAFAQLGQPSAGVLGVVLLASGAVLAWLWRYLGNWRLPVAVYMLVISLMVGLGLGVARVEVWLGALLFYLSDLFVARQRFVVAEPINKWLGLPLYYAGVYLLAWSVRAL